MTTQISSPCITTTDICNGSYGCGTDTEMAVLARVVPVWEKDEWSIGKAYGPLSVVKAPGTDTLYISKVPVPCGIELGDPKYWSVYNDNKVASEAKEIAEEARAEVAGAVSAADAASRAVVAEAAARENADSAITTELNAKIMQEQEARETADNSINEEVSRLSSNSDALSARVDELEQNGGSGITSLEERVTAVETVNTQQGTEIETIQSQLTTVNDDMDSMGDQLHGMVEQVGTNSNELDQLIVPGTGTEAGTWKAGPELEKWLGESGGSIQTPVSLADGGTGADNQKDAANNILVRDYAKASMDGKDAWNHGNFIVGNVDTVKLPGNYLLPPAGGNKFVIAQLTGEQEGSTASSGNPVMQMASNGNGMFYTRFFPTGVSTNSNNNWVRLAASDELDTIKSENQEQSTSIANMETELRQLIVPNPDTQQFEKGLKMEEWTSGGGIKRFSFSKNYSNSQLAEELMTYNTPVNIAQDEGRAIAGAIYIKITATFKNEKNATMTKSAYGVCPIIQIDLAKTVTGNGRFYFYPGNSNIPQFVNCYGDFVIIKDIQNHIGIRFDKVLHGFYDDPTGNFEYVRKISITNITNVAVTGEFIYA